MKKEMIQIIVLLTIAILSLIGMSICIAFVVIDVKSKNKDLKSPLQKRISGGIIEGYNGKTDDISIFKGVPFASPPIGNLRWRSPKDVIPWEGILSCKTQGKNPIQSEGTIKPGEFNFEINPDPSVGYSEDCLTMNIWTNKKGKKMPVVFFVYGGAWFSGGNSVEIYNGEYLASQKVIFVCPNYRLGLFGFIGSDVLQEEDEFGSTGNYGLTDLIKGLQWVKDNIKEFGGDPNNVILYGGSAGANLIDMLLICPKAKGLFRRAVSMSYPPDITSGLMDYAAKKANGNLLIKNHSNLERLRKMNSSEVLAIPEAFWAMSSFGPCTDGVYINDVWRNEIALGKSNDIDLITGYNYNSDFPGTGDALFAMMYGISIEGIKEGDILQAVYEISATYRQKAGAKNTYVVQFSHPKPGPIEVGALHDGDKPFFLNYFSPNNDKYWNESDFRMGNIASQYFINFCRTGDPNGKGLPKWEKSTGNKKFFEMGDKSGMRQIDSSKYKVIYDYLQKTYQFDFIN